MDGYLDKDFIPDRLFWHSMYIGKTCPICGYKGNGVVNVWDLLNGPVDAECNKCYNKWSVAIPLGDNPQRRKILALLEAEKKFYKLRDELRETINFLHGREDSQ
jgi:hypothetical protein